MLTFHEITLEDREWMDPKFREDNRQNCENSFANNFMWRKVYQVQVANVENCAVIQFMAAGRKCYSYPIGNGDKRKAIELLMENCQQEGITLHMSPMTEKDREELLGWFPGEFLVEADRDSFDYIYTVKKLTTLSGKKLHGKRNHIARFKDGDDWSYEPFGPENMSACMQMTREWTLMREEKWNDEMSQEMLVLEEAVTHFTELGLTGGVLKKAGNIVAFCVGEPLSDDTFVVHFEKAFPDMQGAYPMINQQFVEHTCQDFTYVNREEDTGDPGLRKAKLSYYPDILLTKYAARKSAVVFADPVRDRDGIVKIWSECFGDEEAYIDFYIEKRMTKENMLTIWHDGQIVSMASFLPAEYVQKNGEKVSARYVYAVATLPEYRSKGYAKEILMFARELWQEPLVLSPAEDSLCAYYEGMGFVKAFQTGGDVELKIEQAKRTVTQPQNTMQQSDMMQPENAMQEQEENDYYIEEVSAAQYMTIRNQHFDKPGALLWNEAAIQYAIEMNASLGGKTVIIIENEDSGREEAITCDQAILMYYVEADTLVILETTLQETCMQHILPEIMAEYQATKVVLKRFEGMLLPAGNLELQDIVTDGYLNLILS